MDRLAALRNKIRHFREEIAGIQESSGQFRRAVRNDAVAQAACGWRSERLQAIQRQLMQLSELGRGVGSTEQIKEKRSPRQHTVKQKPAA
jgi:hypothetical protein